MTRPPRRESGFVLIGVIMFVLALTILGMSLFALSTYEGQFLDRSHDDNAALYAAQGGVDFVLQLLQVNWSLDDAAQAQGHEGIDSVYVSQPQAGGGVATSGPMNDSTVTIRIVAHANQSQRRLVVQYDPLHHDNYYTRLFTAVSNIVPNATTNIGPNNDRTNTIVLSGPVWQAGGDYSWSQPSGGAAHVHWINGGAVRRDPLTRPDITGFLAMHLSNATPAQIDSLPPLVTIPGSINIELLGAVNGQPTYFTVPYTDYSFSFRSLNKSPVTITVNGVAVWLAPRGVFFDHKVVIAGTGCLIIVAKRNDSWALDPGLGIQFFGGVVDPTVPMVLVTDGEAEIESIIDELIPSSVPALSVYSDKVILTGPNLPLGMQLTYVPAVMDNFIRTLPVGALPRALGESSTSFTFVPGSWQDVSR
jgi:hypothetical protein